MTDKNCSSSSNNNVRTRVGKYELGHTLGSGNFAKVKYARNLETGKQVAIKILEKDKILKVKMTDQEDGLLHTTCGTPNYVAPEVIVDRGYNGAKADLWSCGVILFVLMAGYLPFNDPNLITMYKKIYKAEFSFPSWFSPEAKRLITRILTPNPKHRINVSQILQDPWFKKGYKPEKHAFFQKVKLEDVDAVFNDESSDHLVTEQRELKISRPTCLNAFELISLNKGLNLSSLFEKKEEMKLETRFASKCPAPEIISKMEETAKPLGFNVQKRDYKMKLQGAESGRKGHLSIATEVFEVTPSLFLVEMRKAGGDTLEYQEFYQNFSTGLKDIVWTTEDTNVAT